MRFVSFLKKENLEIESLLDDLQIFCMNMYLEDLSRVERQSIVLNSLEQYYKANHCFRVHESVKYIANEKAH
tara:strand:+ start:16739 stop:16954 length:216 start_codon:yes stop_codon:yes gene_type:complete